MLGATVSFYQTMIHGNIRFNKFSCAKESVERLAVFGTEELLIMLLHCSILHIEDGEMRGKLSTGND